VCTVLPEGCVSVCQWLAASGVVEICSVVSVKGCVDDAKQKAAPDCS